MLRHLVDLQYQRNDADLARARFRVRGDTLEFRPASEERIVRVEFFGDEVERITEVDPLTGELLAERKDVNVYPATHYVTPNGQAQGRDRRHRGRDGGARRPAREPRAASSRARGCASGRRSTWRCSASSASAPASRTTRATCRGARPGSRPWTLLDYFPPDWLLVVDESHMTVPQVVGMYKNDRTRKEILVDFGFRLPSALDNRPLTFEEFEAIGRPGDLHVRDARARTSSRRRSGSPSSSSARPGIVDPPISVRPTEGQIDDLMEEIKVRVDRGERAIVTTLTKRMAEDLTDYLRELGVKVQYLHSEVDTLERVAILRDLRLGVFDVVVGINLLREGIDLPEVTLVAILDADKEGFLRSAWSLIQMIGRAARNIGGEVVMYADRITESMRAAIDETDRRRAIQEAYNLEHGIEPTTIVKGIRDLNDQLRTVAEGTVMYTSEREARDARLLELDTKKVEELVARMEAEMRAAAKELEFERAAALRDEIQQIRLRVLDEDQSAIIARAAELRARSGRRRAVAVRGAAAGRRTRCEPPRAPIRTPGSCSRSPSVTVLPAGVEPTGDAEARPRARRRTGCPASATSTRTSAGWQARWLDRPTWDRTVTPNIRRRQGTRRRAAGADRLPARHPGYGRAATTQLSMKSKPVS